jgi:hypothetical protein
MTADADRHQDFIFLKEYLVEKIERQRKEAASLRRQRSF